MLECLFVLRLTTKFEQTMPDSLTSPQSPSPCPILRFKVRVPGVKSCQCLNNTAYIIQIFNSIPCQNDKRRLHHIDWWCTEPKKIIYRFVRLQLLLKFYYHSSTNNSESQFQVFTFKVQVLGLLNQVQVLKNRTRVRLESKFRTRIPLLCLYRFMLVVCTDRTKWTENGIHEGNIQKCIAVQLAKFHRQKPQSSAVNA